MESTSNLISKDALEDLIEIQKVFNLFGVRVFVAYGAVLGWIRDKDFIPYDDDIDLVVVDMIDLETRKKIGVKLGDLGFMAQSIYFNVFDTMEMVTFGPEGQCRYDGDEETGIIVCRKRINASIFFFKEENCPQHGKEMVCIPKYKGKKLICSPSKFYEKGEIFKFKGNKFLIPSPIKEYLEFTYGNWKEKIKGKHAKQYLEYHKDSV